MQSLLSLWDEILTMAAVLKMQSFQLLLNAVLTMATGNTSLTMATELSAWQWLLSMQSL
jgi:hypothetical protein